MTSYLDGRLQRYFKAGSVICKEGEYGSTMYIITSGEVEVSKVKNNQKVVLATLQKGAVFGEMALLDQPIRSATVQALTDVSCLEISKLFFNTSMQQLPNWIRSFFQILVERLREADKKQDTFTIREKSKQIVLGLTLLFDLFTLKSDDLGGLRWHETIEKLEILLNIPAENIERIINHLIAKRLLEKIIDYKDGRLIKISNEEKFRNFSRYCRESLMTKMNKKFEPTFVTLSEEKRRFIEYLGQLMKEQPGVADFELDYLEARCQELLGCPLTDFDSSIKLFIQEGVLELKRNQNGEKYYHANKSKIHTLLEKEQLLREFQQIENQLESGW